MYTIAQCLAFPNGTPVSALTIKVKKVYERKEMQGRFGPTSVQNIILADAAGSEIKTAVWGHPDCTPLVNQDLILHCKKDGDIKVKHKSWDDKDGKKVNSIELEVTKNAVFQYVSVYNQTAKPAQQATQPQPTPQEAPQQPIPANSSADRPAFHAPTAIRGDKVGMAIKAAIDILGNTTKDFSEQSIWSEAAKIIKVSIRLEGGEISAPSAQPAADATPQGTVQPAGPDDHEDSIPF